jgi:hypothetical protein
MKIEMISRIGYSDVFFKKAKPITFLKNLDIDSALEFLAAINKYEYKLQETDVTEASFICKEWLANSKQSLKDAVVNSYMNTYEKKQSVTTEIIDFYSIKIINKLATLRAIEILLSNTETTSLDRQKGDTNENLFLFYLAVNDEIAERESILFKGKLHNIDKKENEIRFHLFMGLVQSTGNQETPNKKVWSEILKFVQFEKWISDQEKYKDFVVTYLEQFGVATWYELITIIFILNNIAINHVKFTKDLEQQHLKLLSYFAGHDGHSTDWNELTEIIKKPLYKLKNEEYLILDNGYLLDKFFSGIYHDLLGFSSKKSFNKFHQDYSKNFVEGFLLVNTMKAVFGKSYIQFPEERIKEKKIKGIENLALPDYYVRNGNKVYIIECKNSFLSNKLKIEADFDSIERDICDKFYQTSTKKKGVKQLSNFIELSQQGKYQFFDKVEKLHNLKYYPILVVTDRTLCSIGFNKLFNEYFSNEIKANGNSFSYRIKPLTIIHINDFLFRTSKLKKLDILIEDYYKYCDAKIGIDSMVSFTDFLDVHKLRENYDVDHKSIEHIMKNSVISNK